MKQQAKTREEELKERAYQTLNQKDYGEWCFAEGKRQALEEAGKIIDEWIDDKDNDLETKDRIMLSNLKEELKSKLNEMK